MIEDDEQLDETSDSAEEEVIDSSFTTEEDLLAVSYTQQTQPTKRIV